MGDKNSNDVSFLSSYRLGPMDGQKSANSNNINNHTLGSKNHNNNNTTTTTASVPNMLLVRY